MLHKHAPLAWATALWLTGCAGQELIAAPIPLADGIFAALGAPLPAATAEQLAAFERGTLVVRHAFTRSEGLGPRYNAVSCSSCHERPELGGSAARYRNFHFVGDVAAGAFVPTGINGIQDQFDTLAGRDADDPLTNILATRNPTAMFGAGLLAEVSEKEILSRADPDDEDGDGISGRANYDRGLIARFGLKAQTVSIEGFIRGPLLNHLGITSNPLTDTRAAQLMAPTPPALKLPGPELGDEYRPTMDNDGVADPELSEQDLFDLASFSMLLAAPAADAATPETQAGAVQFHALKCDGCHTPVLRGPRGGLPAYTDLLLHDMGDELADGVAMKLASGREFRTSPLWGAAAVGPYLHDGRADTFDAAIRYHGGEAQRARAAYVELSDSERAVLMAFLSSLGGSPQKSDGLLRSSEAAPAVGELGGPIAALATDDAARFDRGRHLFDRDFGTSAGLGPQFNGDSCRACHFQPVLGGAGPIDVNVIRQSIVDAGGASAAPEGGTMVHRLTTALGVRPSPDPRANFFQQRQTPLLFGVGLIDRIPEATLRSHADPDDADHDGIRGRVRVLADGRVGRFGWKAGVPSVREFLRDAMLNELGVTLPAEAGLTFGASTDQDGTADPELGAGDVDALVFFMLELAPPSRVAKDAALEARGAQVFTTVGCAACHLPAMSTSDGVEVPLYSDLLLHQVLVAGSFDIADDDVLRGAFRTPPLWGVSRTAPYFHDGRALSLDGAIASHDGEAAPSRARASSLSAGDHAALLAFLGSL